MKWQTYYLHNIYISLGFTLLGCGLFTSFTGKNLKMTEKYDHSQNVVVVLTKSSSKGCPSFFQKSNSTGLLVSAVA